MLSWPFPRRFLGMGGGPREGSRVNAAGGGASSNSRRPWGAPAPPAASLDFFIPSFAPTPAPRALATFDRLTPPPTCFSVGCLEARFAVVRWTGRFVAARFDFGRAERFDFARALERDFVLDFGRDERRDFDLRAAEARFFIFLGLRDLDFLLERFPAIDRSFWGDKPDSLS